MHAYFLLAQQSPWESLELLFFKTLKAGQAVHYCFFYWWVYSAKHKWSFCCWVLCCSNSSQASQGWKNWVLQIFKNSSQLFHSRSSLHPPSNFYMVSSCFPVCPSPWFQVIGCCFIPFFAYLSCFFFLLLCKEKSVFIFIFVHVCSAVWGRRVLMSCHVSVNRARIWKCWLCCLSAGWLVYLVTLGSQ